MEEVLGLYEEDYGREKPVVCFDEKPCQLLADMREPLAPRPEERGVAHSWSITSTSVGAPRTRGWSSSR
jgi:hypothetical protein